MEYFHFCDKHSTIKLPVCSIKLFLSISCCYSIIYYYSNLLSRDLILCWCCQYQHSIKCQLVAIMDLVWVFIEQMLNNSYSNSTMMVYCMLFYTCSQLLYEESLRRLREEVIRANVLVREANQLSSEMKKDSDFAVTLQVREKFSPSWIINL